MSSCALMMVKDEADVIEATVRHLVTQVDRVYVADNASTDGTHEILHRLASELGPDALRVRHDDEVGYYQSRKMSEWAAEIGRDAGFDWLVPCDADEVWYSVHGRVGDLLGAMHGVDVAEAPLWDHVATAQDPAERDGYRDAFATMGWRRREQGFLPKVAVRLKPGLVIEMGNHDANYSGESFVRAAEVLTIRHFPYRSPEQMVSKARNGGRAYEASDLDPGFGAHWRDYWRLIQNKGEEALHGVFREHFWVYDPASDPSLIYDPVPIHR